MFTCLTDRNKYRLMFPLGPIWPIVSGMKISHKTLAQSVD